MVSFMTWLMPVYAYGLMIIIAINFLLCARKIYNPTDAYIAAVMVNVAVCFLVYYFLLFSTQDGAIEELNQLSSSMLKLE